MSRRLWRLYQTALGPHHSQITTSAHSASSFETPSSCSPSAAHWSIRTSRSGWRLKYRISGPKNFRSCPAITTRSGPPSARPDAAGASDTSDASDATACAR